MLKKRQVHMLPTEFTPRVGRILLNSKTNKLCFGKSNGTSGGMVATTIDTNNVEEANILLYPQHLYFTTDEEIKEGDWYIDSLVSDWEGVGPLKMMGFANNEKTVISSYVGTTSPVSVSRKIIASTDPNIL